MSCRSDGCQRARRPDSPYCAQCFRAVVLGGGHVAVDATPAVPGRPDGSTGPTRPVYRVRTRGRIEVRIEGGHWQRMGTIPKGGIRI
jgi:hypothetical protein